MADAWSGRSRPRQHRQSASAASTSVTARVEFRDEPADCSTRSATAPTSSPTSSRSTSTASAPSRSVRRCGWSGSSRCCRSTAGSRTPATSWWLWTCLAGFGLGLFGLEYCRRRRKRARTRGRSRPSRGLSRLRTARSRPTVSVSKHRLRQRQRLAASWPAGPRSGRRSRGRTRRPGRRRWRRRWRRRRTSPTAGRRAGPGSRRWCSWSGADWASGASGPPSPSYHRWAASSRPSSDSVRTRPRPRSWATVRIAAFSSASSGSSPSEVRRDQPRVVVLDGQQVARRQVARLDPLAVGHPRRGDDRLVAREQHDLVDGDRLLARRPGRR